MSDRNEQELKPQFWKARVLFGQMRDDVEVERRLVQEHGAVRRALVITSGGCGAMSLTDMVAGDSLGGYQPSAELAGGAEAGGVGAGGLCRV